MSIYDRTKWPAPENNPLLLMLKRGDAWFTNTEILAALGHEGRNRSLISQWPTLAEQIGESETLIEKIGWWTPDNRHQARGGGQERYFSRKALVIIAMRAQTINAAAFRDIIADDMSIEDYDAA